MGWEQDLHAALSIMFCQVLLPWCLQEPLVQGSTSVHTIIYQANVSKFSQQNTDEFSFIHQRQQYSQVTVVWTRLILLGKQVLVFPVPYWWGPLTFQEEHFSGTSWTDIGKNIGKHRMLWRCSLIKRFLASICCIYKSSIQGRTLLFSYLYFSQGI